MAVSNKVINLLQKKHTVVDYTITENNRSNIVALPSANEDIHVCGVLFRDSQKKLVQVLIPSRSIINIDSLFRAFQQPFSVVSLRETWDFISEEQLRAVPGIPSWHKMPTYIEKSLLKEEKLLLEPGDGESLVCISKENFNHLVGECHVGSFCDPVIADNSSADHDEQDILDSLKKFTERRIRQRLEETLELPPLPETAQRIIKLRADPNADISDLSNIVEIDPSLAAQVVSWASSPYYSAPGKIKSVHDAIVRVLGFDMVLNLSLGLALGKTLSMKGMKQEDINDYWRGAVYTAALVEGLVTSIKREYRPSFGMAYLSGLLNNFGNLILAEIYPPYFKTLSMARLANPHLPASLVERSLLGVAGNQISSWLMDNWSMPEEVVVALRQQDNPAYDGDHGVYAKLILISRQLLSNKGFGNNAPAEIDAELFNSLHLDANTANTVVDSILEAGEDLDAIAEKMRS